MAVGISSARGNFGVDVSVNGVNKMIRALKQMTDAKTNAKLKQLMKGGPARILKNEQKRILRTQYADSKGATIYRGGTIYAKIKRGQLAKSIGVIKARNQGFNGLNPNILVGPMMKGKYANPEMGGWYAHFLEYGTIRGIPARPYVRESIKKTKLNIIPEIFNRWKTLQQQNIKRANLKGVRLR